MPRGGTGSGGATARTKSFRFSPADIQRLAQAQRALGLESQAEVVRVLVSRYLEDHGRQRTVEEMVDKALAERLPPLVRALVEQLLEQLGPELVARVLAQVVADGLKAKR